MSTATKTSITIEAARQFLGRKGCKILAENFGDTEYKIDFVVADDTCNAYAHQLLFVSFEVIKTAGEPVAAYDNIAEREHIAKLFIEQNPEYEHMSVRHDALVLVMPSANATRVLMRYHTGICESAAA